MLSPSIHIFIPFLSLPHSRTEWHLTAVSQYFLSLNQIWLLLPFSKIYCPLIQYCKIKRTEVSSLQFWEQFLILHSICMTPSFLSQLTLIFSILFTQDLSRECSLLSPSNLHLTLLNGTVQHHPQHIRKGCTTKLCNSVMIDFVLFNPSAFCFYANIFFASWPQLHIKRNTDKPWQPLMIS